MRKLASIQRIRDIKPIEGADKIELVSVLGWNCIAKKGEFKEGDIGIYFEIDAFLPIDNRFEFLRPSSYKKNEIQGEGFRIKTMNLRGQLSQGLIMPLIEFPEVANFNEGDDVSEILGVIKWDPPESVGPLGTSIGQRPYGIPKTDETRLQSIEDIVHSFKGKPYYITTKMDGTSCTMYVKDGIFGVTGRKEEYKEDPSSPMWAYAIRYGIKDRMLKHGRNIAIQGEFCGPGIQNNRLKLKEPMLYVFDVYDIDKRRYLNYEELVDTACILGLRTVPIEEAGDSFYFDFDTLLERARGIYPSGKYKEGIVVRLKDGKPLGNGSRPSFKVINNDWLLKEK